MGLTVDATQKTFEKSSMLDMNDDASTVTSSSTSLKETGVKKLKEASDDITKPTVTLSAEDNFDSTINETSDKKGRQRHCTRK